MVFAYGLQALNERKACVQHHRKLPREDGYFSLLDPGSSEGDVNTARRPLLLDRDRGNLFTPQYGGQRLLAVGESLSRYRFIGADVFAAEDIYWHGVPFKN